MLSGALIGDYWYQQVPQRDFRPIFDHYRPKIFGDVLDYFPSAIYTDEEKANIKQLAKSVRHREVLHLVIKHNEAFAGWCVGWQEDATRFKMTSTGLLPQHRGHGVYSALLPELLGLLKARGYQQVTSRHHATNNAVLVPKLKAGFVITGFELSDHLGVMVHLSYFFNETRRKMLDFRAGSQLLDAEVLATLAANKRTVDSAENWQTKIAHHLQIGQHIPAIKLYQKVHNVTFPEAAKALKNFRETGEFPPDANHLTDG